MTQLGYNTGEMQNLNVDEKGVVKMKLMVARTSMVAMGMNRKGNYTAFCDFFKNEYIQEYALTKNTAAANEVKQEDTNSKLEKERLEMNRNAIKNL